MFVVEIVGVESIACYLYKVLILLLLGNKVSGCEDVIRRVRRHRGLLGFIKVFHEILVVQLQ